MEDTVHLHTKVKDILYSLTGITLSRNKDIMIANRLHKLKRNSGFEGDIVELLQVIEHEGKYTTEFIDRLGTSKWSEFTSR